MQRKAQCLGGGGRHCSVLGLLETLLVEGPGEEMHRGSRSGQDSGQQAAVDPAGEQDAYIPARPCRLPCKGDAFAEKLLQLFSSTLTVAGAEDP